MMIKEGKLKFNFNENAKVIKFDDDSFYRKHFNKVSESKGVDFICLDGKSLIFLEIKDCLGEEKENFYRISSQKKDKKEPLEEEIPKKVSSTISCLVGAVTRKNSCEISKELLSICDNINFNDVADDKKQIFVILLLEGEFQMETFNKKMIMKRIQNKIKDRLKWLECKVSVIDIENNKGKFFTIEREG